MTRTDLAVIVSAAAVVAGLTWFAFTRNGSRAVYVGRHRLAAARSRHMPRYRQWRDRLAPAVRGCLHWPAGQMPRPDELAEITAWLHELREPVAASAPGDGPAPSGAGPLTSLPDGEHPYPLPLTAPQPALRELLEPLPAARPYVPEMLS